MTLKFLPEEVVEAVNNYTDARIQIVELEKRIKGVQKELDSLEAQLAETRAVQNAAVTTVLSAGVLAD